MRVRHGRRSRLELSWPSVVAVGVALLVFGGFFLWDHLRRARLVREHEAARTAEMAARAMVFARGEFEPVFELCREGWLTELAVHVMPAALGWSRTSLDGYVSEGLDARSWRWLRCTAQGVERPWLDALPPEASAEVDDAAAETWRLALERLSHVTLRGGELAVELLQDPATGEVVWRRWRGVEAGLEPLVEPPHSRAFPSLIATPGFAPTSGKAPPPLPRLEPKRWPEHPMAAFAVVERALPADARIAEFALRESAIEVTAEGPTPNFDGDPPAPFGRLDFDEYGFPKSTLWYPYMEPGFGCSQGSSLAEVQAAFETAWATLGKAPLSFAWFSCSTTFSDGRHGVWHLDPR